MACRAKCAVGRRFEPPLDYHCRVTRRERILAEWRDAGNWHFFYSVYACKRDPRRIVPKINSSGDPRWWLGATFNFAHPSSFLWIAAAIVGFVGPPCGLYFAGIRSPLVLGIVALVSLLILWRVAWTLASLDRL